MTVTENDVTIATPAGQADAALFHPEGEGQWPGVLVWPDALGLRPTFREMGRRLASSGYTVLVVNQFYRHRPAPVFEGGVDFSDPDQRAKVMSLIGSMTPEFAEQDAAAYVDFLDARPETDTSKPIGVQGYCMGGALAFRTAAASDRVGAVASFHGGGLASDATTSPHLLVGRTKAEFLVAIADSDHQADPKVKDTVSAALGDAGRQSKVEVYDGAAHGWTVPDSAVYDEPSAERAWSELLDLYGRALG